MLLNNAAMEVIHPDTQAVLLLCGTFGEGTSTGTKPLNLTEYNALALQLKRQGRRPADLLREFENSDSTIETGLPSERIQALLSRGMQMALSLEKWHRLGLWVISRGENCYPERLRLLRAAAPMLLFGIGDLTRLNRGGLAIVGSRNADDEALSFTRRIAERCASQDIQVISGGARGIDQTAVGSALENGGSALVVLSDHLDRAVRSREVKEAVRDDRLTLVTPYQPEWSFTVGRAMGRNKYIYALADHALVVQFTTGSGGTWAGAQEQLRRNKQSNARIPVFFRVERELSEGSRQLQDQGALPFPENESLEGDVIEVLTRVAGSFCHSDPTTAKDHSDSDLPPSNAENLKPPISTSEPVEKQPADQINPPEIEVAKPETALSALAVANACYHLYLPVILRHLREVEEVSVKPNAKCDKKTAAMLHIMRDQLRSWLDRAFHEGSIKTKVITKRGKQKVVYVDATAGNDKTLFGRGGDPA